jgi:hypothetical protein
MPSFGIKIAEIYHSNSDEDEAIPKHGNLLIIAKVIDVL